MHMVRVHYLFHCAVTQTYLSSTQSTPGQGLEASVSRISFECSVGLQTKYPDARGAHTAVHELRSGSW